MPLRTGLLIRLTAPSVALGALLLFASQTVPAAQPQERFPAFKDSQLALGRSVWMANCEPCHAHDVAGAPLVSNRSAWATRIAKGKSALYRSATQGLTGPMGTQMPPRGGNDKLTDAQLRAAVDYMIAIVNTKEK